jgi:hypothetical protein
MTDYSQFFDEITEEVIDEIMVGSAIDVTAVINMTEFAKAAVHCCLNGPVGVGKSTNFPGMEGHCRLKDMYDGRLSNKMWRNFCRVVGEFLIRSHPEKVEVSQQRHLNGDIWPQNEDE